MFKMYFYDDMKVDANMLNAFLSYFITVLISY